MRTLVIAGAATALAVCLGCETVPHLRASPVGAASPGRALVAVTDARTALSKSSLVERSGTRPIVLLGDERFDVAPIEVLENKVLKTSLASAAIVVQQLDVRYVQGGNLDELTSTLSFSASVISPVLGSLVYGGMANAARRKDPSVLDITVTGTVRSLPFSVQHSQPLTGSNESDDVRAAVDAATDKVVAVLMAR